jgi:hypothetical protein
MPEYRIYVLSSPSKIHGPALNIVCNSDDEAVGQAEAHLTDGRSVEIWQGARVVRRLRSEDAR